MMRNPSRPLIFATLLLSAWVPAVCQNAGPETGVAVADSGTTSQMLVAAPTAISPAVQALLAFKDSDVKFSVAQLMNILQDKRHEGWVLAAYPDPKTSRPLIGAGFSLDLPVREHPQLDSLNPNLFFEPSSAELWQAAGLEPAALTKVLDQFHAQLANWTIRQFRRNIRYLPTQITDDDASKLLRIAIIQSIVNARAYCRNFDDLTASQQMALSQLVYQMGVNLEQFTQFRALINRDATLASSADGALRDAALQSATLTGTAYWKAVQQSLIQSQWARLYRARAVAVVAMLDPRYADSPTSAERRVSAVLRPAVVHRKRTSARASTRLVASRGKAPQAPRKSARAAGKKKS